MCTNHVHTHKRRALASAIHHQSGIAVRDGFECYFCPDRAASIDSIYLSRFFPIMLMGGMWLSTRNKSLQTTLLVGRDSREIRLKTTNSSVTWLLSRAGDWLQCWERMFRPLASNVRSSCVESNLITNAVWFGVASSIVLNRHTGKELGCQSQGRVSIL